LILIEMDTEKQDQRRLYLSFFFNLKIWILPNISSQIAHPALDFLVLYRYNLEAGTYSETRFKTRNVRTCTDRYDSATHKAYLLFLVNGFHLLREEELVTNLNLTRSILYSFDGWKFLLK